MQDGPANAPVGVAADPPPDRGDARSIAPEPVVGAPLSAWLFVPGAGLVVAGLVIVLAPLAGLDARSVQLGALAALLPTAITPAVMGRLGRRPVSLFGVCEMVTSMTRNLVSAGAAWALLARTDADRNTMLGALGVVLLACLIAEKIVAVRALRPAWTPRAECSC